MPGHVNVGGTWKTVSGISANVSGTWKTVQSGHVNVSGTWKQFYQNTIPATFLVVNAGQARSGGGSYYWNDGCFGQNVTQRPGGNAGRHGTGSITISPGTSYAVVVATSLGGGSTFNSLAWNSAGVTQGTGYSGGSQISSANWSCCDYYCQYGYSYPQTGSVPVFGGGAGSGGNSSGTNGGASLSLGSTWNNLIIGSGGGASNQVGGSGSAGSPTASYGSGEGASGTNGVVVIKYADSLPLPVSGTYSAATSGGFRFLTCTASTTLVW